MKHKIFVYGTLKRGGSNHSLLAGQKFVTLAHTQPLYRLYALSSYPAMIEAPQNGRSIEGEIWEIEAARLPALDQLEDVAHGMYKRVPILLLPLEDTLAVEGYVYLLSTTGRRDCGEVWNE
ncbi:MAG: gamma-glutamylcyclotransferase [Verrucomicrobia bacterium]|nr:gamma-glutamylcyclotransferase [Verrucomicrobiota bacterium]